MSNTHRQDGFAPIGDYAVLGDGRTAALVSRDGSVDWWPIPSLDSPPVCAAVLDPDDGGHFRLAPAQTTRVERRYVERTNVLETTYLTESGTVRVTESLNVGTAGRLPWTELARRVEGLSGRVRMVWELAPGDRFKTARPWAHRVNGSILVHLGDQSLAVITSGAGEPQVDPHRVAGEFSLGAGESALVAVVASDDEPLPVPSVEAVDRRIDSTVEHWRRWADGVDDHAGRWSEQVMRSALALKTLLYAPGGAIAAAATTSLPERIGGPKNWDYRYAWVRDSSFTIDAFMHLGLHEEVHAAVSWLVASVRRTAPDLHVFYDLDGDVADEMAELNAPGYRNSRPVRSGNSAAGQRQLGTYGDLFDTVHRYVEGGHLLDAATARLLESLANHCCDRWRSEDSGIWELDERRQYTISKIGCWVALDRAVRLAEDGHIADGEVERWKAERASIKEWVQSHCWSETKRSYTFYAGGDELDAAVLLAARTGFDTGERLRGTIEAVRSELGAGPLLYRYSGMQAEEGAFIACSFWLVEALAHTGQWTEAEKLMGEMMGVLNDVGLMSEQMDPDTGEALGNVPQGLSHLALVNAACTLADQDGTAAEQSGAQRDDT